MRESKSRNAIRLAEEDIAEVVAMMTGIPVKRKVAQSEEQSTFGTHGG
jgi:ATP-dependent Clp protease ATP-binding subunit ClpA